MIILLLSWVSASVLPINKSPVFFLNFMQDVEQYNKLEDPTDEENDMLDLAFGLTETWVRFYTNCEPDTVILHIIPSLTFWVTLQITSGLSSDC